MLPAFGSDGHFLLDSPDAVPIWSPLVSQFLEKHSATGNAQQQVSSSSSAKEFEAKLPRLRLPQKIQFSNWQKLCFESSDDTTICRTTSTGTDDLNLVVARVDLIQRADGPAAGGQGNGRSGAANANPVQLVSHQHLHRGRPRGGKSDSGTGIRQEFKARTYRSELFAGYIDSIARSICCRAQGCASANV